MSKIIQLPADAFAPDANWTREQSILAFRFYCETSFGQLHSKNKKVIALAELIGRTPGAVARKCTNFAHLDPVIRASGRTGSKNHSALDEKIWAEFHANWDALVQESEELTAYLRQENNIPEPNPDNLLATDERDFTGEVRTALVNLRVGQDFFRRSVLSGYGEKCCISGVSDKRFLIASHIVAWNEDASIRLHPGNGLCLSAIHDKAFDKHLFSLTDDHRIILSSMLRETKDDFLRQVFWPTEDKQIALPEKFIPETEFLARHRQAMMF